MESNVGLIGGKVVSHYEQGKRAGLMTKDILDGKKPKENIVYGSTLNKVVFDYEQLKVNKIRKKDLPKTLK